LDGENIISWNFANWVTVLLMVGVAFAIYGFIARTANARKGSNGNSPASATTA
jgi:hypothetical protein